MGCDTGSMAWARLCLLSALVSPAWERFTLVSALYGRELVADVRLERACVVRLLLLLVC